MTLRIDVASDVICPWCFMGKRFLEEALRRAEGRHEIGVRWLPFQLNPDLPPGGMERAAYFEKKFGSENARRIYARIERKGREAGIAFNFDAIERTPNTFDAHRLIGWARREGRGEAVVEGLFQGFFLEGKDVGDRRVLAEVAGAAELKKEEADRFLESSAGADEVREEERGVRRLQISGVPTFIVARRYAVSGAQKPEVLTDLLDQAAAELEPS